MITSLHSIKRVERQYATGEEPLLVLCSDMNEYVCKYPRTNGAAYKMVSELIGAQLAHVWNLKTPPIALIKISSDHWIRAGRTGILALGSRRLNSVIDINPATEGNIIPSFRTVSDLLHVALFDFWVANEDRNANNANLMYEVDQDAIISIDYGCIFNTSTYDYSISKLTLSDTILSSGLFNHLKSAINTQHLKLFKHLHQYYMHCINNSKKTVKLLLDDIPVQWNVPYVVVEDKLNQLFDEDWVNATWNNFIDCFNENV